MVPVPAIVDGAALHRVVRAMDVTYAAAAVRVAANLAVNRRLHPRFVVWLNPTYNNSKK